MDNNDLKVSSNSDNVYRATTNLNTAIENPDVTINTATNVNIQNVNSYNQLSGGYDYFDNSMNGVVADLNNNNLSMQYDDKHLNQFISSNAQEVVNQKDIIVGEERNTLSGSEKVSYEPTIKAKKKPSKKVPVSKEVKAMAVIIFILLMFVFAIPYIYDFLKELGLIITS